MSPYSARGEENGNKRHRAVLIPVELYSGKRKDLPAVRHNLRLMTEALTAEDTGMLGPKDLVVVPETDGPGALAVDPLQVRAALSAAREEVTGLLVVYFAGHGIVRTDGSDFHLLFSSSRVTSDRQHPFVGALSWRDDVMPELRAARADWVVVILDCCFAGNALQSFNPAVGQNFALLTAAEHGVEIPSGDAARGTEFTVGLHRLLTGRTAAQKPATFTRLVTEIREAMAPLKAVDGHPWIPDERRHGDDVLLALTCEGPRPSPPVPPGWRRLLSRLRRNRTTALVLAGVALAGAGTWAVLPPSGGGADSCAPPMELRVLTDPDIRPTVQKAADAYLKRDGEGCRPVGITVYDAKATDAVAAFRSSSLWQEPPVTCPSSGDCLRPQRDLGAQPDIWIPAAESAWQRVMEEGGSGGSAAASASTEDGRAAGSAGAARSGEDPGERAVTFERLGPVAFTPMVLAVPYSLALAREAQTGFPLGTIISELHESEPEPVSVLRPDPEGTDGALLSTEALYTSPGSGAAGTLERGMAQALRPMPATAAGLMCALADGSNTGLEDRAAVLVPEQTMARFNLSPSHPGRPSCATEALERRTAQYPSDIPVLDLPFLRVTWGGADRDAEARGAAVNDFHDWLVKDPEAQKYFTRDGFRGVGKDGEPAPPGRDSLLMADGNVTAVSRQIQPAATDAATVASLTETLRHYRQALGPGRVLYLLDNSTSMADKRVWDGTGRAKELVARSMGSLSALDTYGVRSPAVDKGRKAVDVVPFGRHSRRDAAQEKVAESGTANYNARIAEGLSDALETLREGATEADQQPRLLVLVTDGEDSGSIGKERVATLAEEAKGAPPVRVVVVSLQSGGCSAGRFNERITTASGGRCLDLADDIPTELTAEVARTGTGDAE